MKKLLTLTASIACLGLSISQAQANITFTFTESGGNVLMQSSGVLNTANLISVTASGWGDVGIETNDSPQSDVMGDTTMGEIDTAFAFNTGTDLSAWVGSSMFTNSIFGWSSSGTTQFTTYWSDSPVGGITPGIGIAYEDLIGDLWTPDVSWSIVGTFASLGLTSGTYRITDAVTGESITIQIGTTAVPEPETYAMFMAGLGLMGFVSRRRKTA